MGLGLGLKTNKFSLLLRQAADLKVAFFFPNQNDYLNYLSIFTIVKKEITKHFRAKSGVNAVSSALF